MSAYKEKLDGILSSFPPFIQSYFASLESRLAVKTRLDYAYELVRFVRIVQPEIDALQAVTTDALNKYLNGMSGAGSKAHAVAALRSFFAYLCRVKYIKGNPAMDLETPKTKTKPIIRLDQKEAGKIVNAAKYSKDTTKKNRVRDAAILTLFLTTGIRVSELVGLDLHDFDFTNNSFIVTRKGGNVERLYFGEECRKALMDYIEFAGITNGQPMFLSIRNSRLGVRAVEKLVKKYAAPITDKKITPHKLRSTYGTLLYENTGDIYLVAECLGHRSVETTKTHYAAMSEERRKAAAGKVTLKGE